MPKSVRSLIHKCLHKGAITQKEHDKIIRKLDKAMEWIPCSERLPNEEFEQGRKNGTVYDLYPCLVTRKASHSLVNPDRIYVAKHYFDGWNFLNNGEEECSDDVIAWMPLPEPYREEEKDECQDLT